MSLDREFAGRIPGWYPHGYSASRVVLFLHPDDGCPGRLWLAADRVHGVADGDNPIAGHAPGCDFGVTATIPAGYEEVGTLVYGSRTLSSYRASRDPVEFKDAVRADVCSMGGDLVVTQVDAQGTIVRAAVLRRLATP